MQAHAVGPICSKAEKVQWFSGPCDATFSRDMGPLPTEIVGEDRGPRFTLPPLHKVLNAVQSASQWNVGMEFSHTLLPKAKETVSTKSLCDTFRSKRLSASSDRHHSHREHGQLQVRIFLSFMATRH